MRSYVYSPILWASLVLHAAALSQIDTITILHVNDTHSCLATSGSRDGSLDGERGSIARAASFIGTVKMNTASTILLHAGDVSIGDLFYTRYFAVAELGFMLGIGFDAMTLGNHEFDLGMQVNPHGSFSKVPTIPRFPFLPCTAGCDAMSCEVQNGRIFRIFIFISS